MRLLNPFYLYILFIAHIHAQSTVNKSIDVSGVEEVEIILDNFFQIEIVQTTADKVVFSATSEGEYKDHILIKGKRLERTIVLQDGLQPFSDHHNDKLSAHKVFAATAKIEIPEYLNIVVKSKTASTYIVGSYKNLFVELNSGDCIIKGFEGDAKIHTYFGNIIIDTKNATITATSTSGLVNKEHITGKHQIELKSISGNISVYKTK